MGTPIKAMPAKPCKACGKMMERKRYNGRLESCNVFHRRLYCDMICMGRGHTKVQVKPKTLNQRARRYRGPKCEMCGAPTHLAVHHVDGNAANNDLSNRMTLCGSCHTKWHWQNGKSVPKKQSVCIFCDQPARTWDMCQKHRIRYKLYGDPYLTKRMIGSQFTLVRDEPQPTT